MIVAPTFVSAGNDPYATLSAGGRKMDTGDWHGRKSPCRLGESRKTFTHSGGPFGTAHPVPRPMLPTPAQTDFAMPPGPLAGARILAVDDDEANLRVLRRLLERAGCTVETTPDPTLTLSIVGRFRPDLILLDLNMPVMDGFSVLHALHSMDGGPPPPCLVLSGESPGESTPRALEAGARDFVRKPFDAQDLLTRIGVALEGARSRDDLLHRS
jgi:CheY-like chemotaxis protein